MANEIQGGLRQQYEASMLQIRTAFEANLRSATAGTIAVHHRAAAVDTLVAGIWEDATAGTPLLASSTCLVATGGYGRGELFPYSDVDLMFLLPPKTSEKEIKEPIRQLSQQLWDCGLRLSPTTRSLGECERFTPENVEFSLSLLDARLLAGRPDLWQRLTTHSLPHLMDRDGKKIIARLTEITRHRHSRYGDTLFHLEPNIKDCPGGLRDAHVCAWLQRLREMSGLPAASVELRDGFAVAREFLLLIRTFLHLRHGRDDNTLDWEAQDQAAALSLGFGGEGIQDLEASYWMRLYFRRVRAIDRELGQALEGAGQPGWSTRLRGLATFRATRAKAAALGHGIEVSSEALSLEPAGTHAEDPAHDPETMMAIFAAVARTGLPLSRLTELRLEEALPHLSAHLEDGPGLWKQLERILTARYAGAAFRAMHAIGILELILPEFHGIDALVVRDAYHRYTVDEHTFVVLDTLHGLLDSTQKQRAGMDLWAARFGAILRDLPHPGLLYLAVLLHDTGKGHHSAGHALESVRMAAGVTTRLELDNYESGLVYGLIREHLEMSASLRRDVFAPETVKAFAAHVATPEALKMLALFTYADISAVNPDALTPWKAEKLHHLYLATMQYLDRSVDDDRVEIASESRTREVVHRVSALLPGREDRLEDFLAGFPNRYLLTRTREEILAHFEMAERLGIVGENSPEPETLLRAEVEVALRYDLHGSEVTLVGRDRPMLFAELAGTLAAWGMNIVTADAFSNDRHVVVDTFRFADEFRTLELNESERGRFLESIRKALTGETAVSGLLAARKHAARRAPRVVVEPRIHFEDGASSQSTLMEVVAQDTPGLLYALASSMGRLGCSIEVALIDTEGEMAIDVFYLLLDGAKLSQPFQQQLQQTLLEAIDSNAR